MGIIDNILNGLTYFNPSQLAHTIITILKTLIEFFAKFWSLLFSNIIDYKFPILGFYIDIQISLFFILTTGGFILFILLKLFALIPIIPE